MVEVNTPRSSKEDWLAEAFLAEEVPQFFKHCPMLFGYHLRLLYNANFGVSAENVINEPADEIVRVDHDHGEYVRTSVSSYAVPHRA